MGKTGDILYGQHQQPYVLGAELGSGGEGTVYSTADGKLVAKIYKKPSAKTERKILSMLKLNIDMRSPGGISLITWPKDILYQNGAFAGYVMPFAGGGKPIWNMGRPDGRKAVFQGRYDWSKALAIATNIASLVSYLHSMGIVIGDMNSNNIFVHPNGYVTIMDVDSFDIWDKATGEHFKCQVGRPEYLAPELQARRLSEESAAFTEQTDDFALAVHIFQLLFCSHPFNMKMIDQKKDSKGENQQANAIVEGNCPFVKPGFEHMIQAGVPHMSMLPFYLQEDFRETFSYNALNSVQRRLMRTKAVKWYQDLGRLYQEKGRELVQCTVNPEHFYLRSCGCELCRAKQRMDSHNQQMAQWNIQTVCVNQNQTDVNTNLNSVSSEDKWYSHYRVNNSPLSMSVPLYVRRTYPNGDSSEIQKLPQTYKTGDWISIEGSTQKAEQKRAGLYKIELFDAKQHLLASNSIYITEPSKPQPTNAFGVLELSCKARHKNYNQDFPKGTLRLEQSELIFTPSPDYKKSNCPTRILYQEITKFQTWTFMMGFVGAILVFFSFSLLAAGFVSEDIIILGVALVYSWFTSFYINQIRRSVNLFIFNAAGASEITMRIIFRNLADKKAAVALMQKTKI